MTDERERGPNPTDPMQSFLGQLRSMAEQFSTLGPGAFPFAGTPGDRPRTTSLPPLPGSLTAAQLRAIAASVAAQRSAIAAMTEQLGAFDSQLEVLESIIAPLVRWSQTWADAEKTFTPKGSAPPTTDQA